MSAKTISNLEDKIERYFSENIKLLRQLNKLLVGGFSNNRHIFTDKIYDYISPLISNYTSFSILSRMLTEYIYDLRISKPEKEYFINKLYVQLGNLRNQKYIDIPDFVDRKELFYFEEEYLSSIRALLLCYLTEERSDDKEFRYNCLQAMKEKSEPMTILFVKTNFRKFPTEYQKQFASQIKKYLRRMLSIRLVYPIIDMHHFLMLTPKDDFEKQISRESTIEKIESDLIEILTRILERNQEGKSEDEINDYIADLLRSKNYHVTDQTRSGKSMSGQSSGEIDLMIRDQRSLPITIIECLKLKSVSAKGKNENLINHISKLVDNYDGLGLSNKYLIVYCFANDFEEFKQNYRFFLSSYRHNKILKKIRIDSTGQMRGPYGKDISNLKYISTFHRVNGVYQKITHYLINLKKRKLSRTLHS